MKITKITIICVIIMLPFMFIQYTQVRLSFFDTQTLNKYKTVFANAVNDGMTAMRISSVEGDYETEKDLSVAALEAIRGFENSLCFSLGAMTTASREQVLTYVPVVLFIDFDGYYTYQLSEVLQDGQSIRKHVLSPKYYFIYRFEDKIVQLTLSNQVYVIDPQTGSKYEMSLGDVGLDPISKKDILVKTIEKALTRGIDNHNQLVDRSITVYDFHLPTITKKNYDALLEDMGILAIYQGKKVGRKTLDIVGVESASLEKEVTYGGFISSINGEKYFANMEEPFLVNETIVQVFRSKKEAAQNGYYPYPDDLNN